MPVTLLASACPAPVVESSYPKLNTAENTSGTGVLVARTLAAGGTTLSAYWNRNADALDLAYTFGGGGSAFCVLSGLGVSAGSGHNVTIAAGLAAIGGPVELATAYTLAVPPSTARVWIWLQQSGTPTYTTSTTPPATRCVLLGSCVTDGSGVTSVDSSGVLSLRGGLLLRETADVGPPTDTPNAGITLLTKTSTGLYLWDGTGHRMLYEPSGTATATAGAATLNRQKGVITSEALTTAAGSDYTLTLTNSFVSAGSIVLVSLSNGTNTTAPIYVALVTAGSGSVVIKVRNAHAASALNGTIKIGFEVL